MYNFKTIPFFKIIFPFILGIVYVIQFGIIKFLPILFALSVTLLVITFIYRKSKPNKNKIQKIIFIGLVNCVLFLFAHVSFYLYNEKNYTNHFTHFIDSKSQKCILQITDIPSHTNDGLKINADVAFVESDSKWLNVKGKTIIYIKKDDSLNFEVGNFLYINTKWSYLNDPKNPYEFDYKTYLERKNIFAITYTNASAVSKLHPLTFSSGLFIGENIKATIVNTLRNSSLTEEAFSICSALLVGYDDEIDKNILSSFSHSGTLHILSVSGMHTGVIYGIILFLFSLFDKHDKRKKLKCIVLVSILVAFTIITGFSPSVLRASLMLSLIIIGKTFQKQSNSYNTLLVSAFILLLVNPLLILDVGFLLSYFAVFGIMYLYPILSNTIYIENKLLKWFWDSTIISVSATIFTLPISLYFFHQFPTWFIFSNLIIIPISIVIMFCALLIVAFSKVVVIKSLLVKLTNTLVWLIISTSNLTDNPNYGYIDYICFNKIDFLFLTICIILLLLYIKHKRFKLVVAFMLNLLLWTSFTIYENAKQIKQSELIVFNIKQKTFYALRKGNLLYCNKTSLTTNEFERIVKPYIVNYRNLKIINTSNNYIASNSTRFLNITQSDVSSIPSTTNYILISNNSTVKMNTFEKSKPLIIADYSNNYKTLIKLKNLCKIHHLTLHNTKEEGALVLNLN